MLKAIWLTGLSGAGKTTIAYKLHDILKSSSQPSIVLDGDLVRELVNFDLGFSQSDRLKNVQRIAGIAAICINCGIIPIVAVISPLESQRQLAREIIGFDRSYLVHVACPVDECERRDVKGLYAKARDGSLKGLTGLGSEYEPPESPDLTVNTKRQSLNECANTIITGLGYG